MGSDDDESKLAAPKLFGRKKGSSTPPAEQPAPDTDETAPLTPVEAEPQVAEPQVAEPRVAPESVETAPAPAPTEETLVDVAPVEDTAPGQPAPGQAAPATEPVAEPKPAKAPKPARPARQKRPRPDFSGVRVPALSGLQAAALIGLVVGVFLLLATYGALNLCSTVRGASTCGGRAGFPLLLAIGIVAVLGGGSLLRLFQVSSPMSDSFLAVALVAVLTVLFLHDHYDAWWMAIVVPVLSVLAFLLAHWVSVTYIDPADD